MSNYPFNPLTIGQATFNPYVYQNSINPVVPNYQPVVPGPHMEIGVVNGKESASAYSIGPNSSVILADSTNPKIWMVTTDSSGFKVVKGFKIIPDDEDEKEPITQTVTDQMNDLSERLTKLEERMNNYGQSATKSSWQNKSGNGNAQSNDRNSSGSKGSNGNNQSNGSD